ncbi:hypothetical protein DEO72_LG2g3648 [Vigna unguiculata]|uniref:Uncharacterized protein n=1 Tax=Vigna unguiculata TaxID=3917 RepID=A0A4D6L4F2_VIGUN|nr:hypothetical protein DEO72_LG2g3648 [Vigna unguiculata]
MKAGSALSASPAVPSVEKCEKNGTERQPSGAPALGPLQIQPSPLFPLTESSARLGFPSNPSCASASLSFQLLRSFLELLCSPRLAAKPLLTPFQVREARTHSCNAFYDCFRPCVVNLWETAARSDNLAQASPSRLGEISLGSPKLFARRVAQATRSGFKRVNVSLRRGKSRLSENA